MCSVELTFKIWILVETWPNHFLRRRRSGEEDGV